MSDQQPRHYRFEGFQLDARTRELRDAQGELVSLNARAFDALCLLLRHRDRVVGKDELLDTVWAGRVVEENTLTQAISMLRRALGAGAGDHRFIVTLPGRGYRLVAAVEEADSDQPPTRRAGDVAATEPGIVLEPAVPPVPLMPSPGPSTRRRTWLLAGLFGTAGLLALAAWLARAPDPEPAPSKSASALALAAAPRAGEITLAVLPFRSLSTGPRDEGLELGMADTLITRLSRTGGLQVRALSSSQRVAVAPLDARAVGRELGAAYLIEGTTQRAGDQVRINARLLSAADGQAIWADTFDAPIERVFTVQDRMSAAVTSALKLSPALATQRGQSPCDGADPVAYRAYLRGQYQNNRPNIDRMAEALAAFREAVDRDPTCARAWAGMAFAYRATVMTGDGDPRQLFPLAQAAVQKALAIDPQSAEAWASKGFIEFWYDWDWPRAEASIARAIALNPNLAEAQLAMAHLLVNIGRPRDALPFIRRAIALDPLSPLINSLGSFFLGHAGEKDEARKHLQKTLEVEPDAWIAMRIKAGQAMARGDTAQAITSLTRAVEISRRHSNTLALLGKAYLKAGNRTAAERVMSELEVRRQRGYLPATSLAELADALGDRKRTLDLLEQAYRERDVRVSFLLLDWPQLRTEPRYLALLDRLRLPRPALNSPARQERGP
ncbi:MAG: tetratricopeptide repeat protein [Lysobacteraceae bacterium]|nr:MAG: tetratricopeptide repeat protein [Xanthomonadaceae bacterium]